MRVADGEPPAPIEVISSRTFVVGCVRSGTTLLQSVLAAHPRFVSFPETHFFPKVVARNPERRREGLASRDAATHYRASLARIGLDPESASVPNSEVLADHVGAFVDTLDALTVVRGGEGWIEKTPRHLHYIDSIGEHIPDANFVHIVRNGLDVVASLYDVTHQHPRAWGGPRSIEKCVARWNRDVAITRDHIGRSNHHVIFYTDLVKRPQEVLAELSAALGLRFSNEMLDNRVAGVPGLIDASEHWKTDVLEGIRDRGPRFESVFDQLQQERVNSLIDGESNDWVLANS